MYGMVELIEYPSSQDPKLVKMETFQTLEEAVARANSLMEQFFEDYGEDEFQEASPEKPIAFATNGDVDWRAYIAKIGNV